MRRRAGFTLFELLVVIALMGVVTTLGLQTYGSMTTRWNDAQARSNMQSAAGRALESIRRDIAMAPPASFTGQGMLGEPGTARHEDLFWGVDLADDSFVVPVPDPDDPGRLLLIRYFIERGRTTARLVRVASAADEGQNSRVVVAENVVAMAARFRETPTSPWEAAWNHNRMPAQVAISLVMMDPRNPGSQIARREVVSVHAR